MATCRTLPTHPTKHLYKGNILPAFDNSLVGIGPFCDADYKVLFSKDTVTVFEPTGETILTGWREIHGAQLWRSSTRPEVDALPPITNSATTTTLGAFSAYCVPNIEALVGYLHTSSGFPVMSTCLSDIKEVNYSTWPILTYDNAAKYRPSVDETVKVSLTHTWQGFRSTKPNPKSSIKTTATLTPNIGTLLPI